MKTTHAETAAKKEPMPTYRVFVSSTYSDMIPYRDAVKEAIERSNCMAIGMERFGAASIPPLEKCFNELAGCDIYLCAIGMRYGSVDDKTGKSYTQLEFEKAQALGIPILAFLIDEKAAQFRVDQIDRDPESMKKLSEFRTYITDSKTITCDFFADANDLRTKALQAIQNEVEKQEQEHKKTNLLVIESDSSFEEGAELFKRFLKQTEKNVL